MTILNVRTVYDHYVKNSHPEIINPEIINPEMINPEMINPEMIHSEMSRPEMRTSLFSKGFLHESFSTICSLIAHSLILLACIPLLAIKRLPSPLDQFPVVGFYQNQWLDELEYIEAPHMRVSYAAARVIDGGRLMANYNPLTQVMNKVLNQVFIKKNADLGCCDNRCDEACTKQQCDNII